MKAILTDESAKLYGEPSEETISIATINKGDEFELGKVFRKKKNVWVAITLPSGQSGYISGNTKIFGIKKVQLLNEMEEMIDAPGESPNVIKTYPKKSILTAVGVEKVGDDSWVKVKDADGFEGFIRGGAKIKIYQEPSTSGGKKMMATGGVFAALGIVIYIMSLSQTQNTGTSSMMTIALIALGLVQVVQGYVQYRSAAKQNKEKKEE